MTEQPYTRDDLLTEAAHQYSSLTQDPDWMGVGEGMEGDELWDSLSEREFGEAQREIHSLLTSAADVSTWAIEVGAADLEPHEPMTWAGHSSGDVLAVQVATSPRIAPERRDQLVREVQDAVSKAVVRVLNNT